MKFKNGGKKLNGFIAAHNREYAKSCGLTEKQPKDEDEIFIGKELNLKIISIGSKGDGIARYGSYTVIVPNTKPPDKVSVIIKNINNNLIFADLKS